MPMWSNIEIRDANDLRQFNVELNKRIRYYLNNIDVTQILFDLNDIGGTLNLSKGGTGQSLSAPANDSMFFYDVSEGKTDWLTPGAGVVISGTTLYVTGGSANYQTVTDTTTITSAEQGIIECRSTGDITLTLSTDITTQGVSFFITNATTSSAKVTLSPGTTARTIVYDTTEFLYSGESLNLAYNGSDNWVLR